MSSHIDLVGILFILWGLLTALVGEIARDVADPLGELVPDLLAKLVSAVICDRLAHLLAELVVRHGRPGDAHDPEVRGEEAAKREGIESREELPLRQVTRGAENRHGAGLGLAPLSHRACFIRP